MIFEYESGNNKVKDFTSVVNENIELAKAGIKNGMDKKTEESEKVLLDYQTENFKLLEKH